MAETRLHITDYAPRHRDALLRLSYYSRWTHQHLDWYKPRQWLDEAAGQVFLAWQGERLVGYLGLSPPLHGSAWIRLLGIREGHIPAPIIRELWQSAQAERLRCGAASLSLLMSSQWLSGYARQLGFGCLDSIITLGWSGDRLPAPPPSPVKIVPVRAEDLPAIVQIDHLAFQPPWQMRSADLKQAYRISANTTAAMLDGETVGYQMSTRHQGSGHLARLAVTPAHQGKRIGTALLHELLGKFNRQGIYLVTVNTQQNNPWSQRLYRHFGFFRNGFDLEVWHKTLEGSA